MADEWENGEAYKWYHVVDLPCGMIML